MFDHGNPSAWVQTNGTSESAIWDDPGSPAMNTSQEWTTLGDVMRMAATETQVPAQWRSYEADEGLPSDQITAVLEDTDGMLWIGSTGGLSRFDGGLFLPYLEGISITELYQSTDGAIWIGARSGLWTSDGLGTPQQHLTEQHVRALFESADGTIWVGTENGLWFYDSVWHSPEELPQELATVRIWFFLQTSDSSIWVGTDGGPWVHDGTWRRPEELPQGLQAMRIWSLLQDSDNTIWIGTNGGVWTHDGTWHPPSEFPQGLRGKQVRSFLQATDGSIWVGTSGGAWVYDGVWHPPAPDMEDEVTTLLEATDSSVWMGTVGNGLWIYDGTSWTPQPALAGLWIRDLVESADGAIWVGTAGVGLFEYSSSYTQWYRDAPLQATAYAIIKCENGEIWVGSSSSLWILDESGWRREPAGGEDIRSLAQTSDGTVWVGTTDGLRYYREGTWSSVEFDALRDSTITCMLQSNRDGTVWIGTHHGLWQQNVETELWDRHLRSMTLILSLLQTPNGNIWVGTGRGIFVYNGTAWSPIGLLEQAVTSLLQSGDGAIWAGTAHGGLWRLPVSANWSRQGNFLYIPLIFQSRDRRLWVSTRSGLRVYDGTTWNLLTASDGLPGTIVASMLETENGIFLVGTDAGLARYEPSAERPSIRIVAVDGNPLAADGNPSGQPAEITTGDPAVSIQWIAVDRETDTERLLYQYRIDEGTWVESPLNSLLTPVMSDGEHDFSVRAVDKNLNYSDPATVQITVDTAQPNVLITHPIADSVIGETVEIEGGVADTDFHSGAVEYASGASPADADFHSIRRLHHPIEFGTLATWDTQSLDEGKYTIRVRASDQYGHARADSIVVTLDKTPPTVQIMTPAHGTYLGEQTQIRARLSDQYLDGYTLEHAISANRVTWQPIWRRDQIEAPQPEILVDHNWSVPTTPTGSLRIRLTGFDLAGNRATSEVIVWVPQVISREDGGQAASSDGILSVTIPPRSLPQNTIVAINRVPEAEVPSLPTKTHSLGVMYDIAPEEMALPVHKPATLSAQLSEELLPEERTVGFFRHEPPTNAWVFLGGTRRDNHVSVGITQFGRYALVALETPPSLESKTSFTCQPRVFSPQHQATTIFFSLVQPDRVSLYICDLDGDVQRTLLKNAEMTVGNHAIEWDGRSGQDKVLPSAAYLIVFRTGEGTTKTKAVVIRSE